MKKLATKEIIVRGTFTKANAHKTISKANIGDDVILEREPSNEHDTNAIKVILVNKVLFISKKPLMAIYQKAQQKALLPE